MSGGGSIGRSGRKTGALLLAVAAGAAAFTLGLRRYPADTWRIFLVNFVFWSGVAIGGVVFAAVIELTNGRWAGPVRSVAERFARFLPISFVLFLILLAGAPALYPWIEHPPAARAAWFSYSAFAWRDTAGIAALYGLGLAFAGRSRRRAAGRPGSPAIGVLAVVLIIVYAFAFSLLAIDLVMSLEPSWVSTLFPAYIFMGNLYAAIAAVTLAAAAGRGHRGGLPGEAVPPGEAVLNDARSHDLGKLLLGFCLLWTYLFWSQFLVIWYGNLPEEVSFLMVRTRGAWAPLSWSVVALCFAVPFVALLSRAVKRPRPLAGLAAVCLAGMWLERFVLIVPGVPIRGPFEWLGLLVTLGFVALFVLSQTSRPLAARSQAT